MFLPITTIRLININIINLCLLETPLLSVCESSPQAYFSINKCYHTGQTLLIQFIHLLSPRPLDSICISIDPSHHISRNSTVSKPVHPSPPNTMSALLTPYQQVHLDAYAAACETGPRKLRQECILVGGAASIAHGLGKRQTKDIDILVSVEVLTILDEAITLKQEEFRRDCDGTIKWDKRDRQGDKLFEVTIELLDIDGPFVPIFRKRWVLGKSMLLPSPNLCYCVRLRLLEVTSLTTATSLFLLFI